MTKQQLIKEAYGDSYDGLKDYINENGFVDCVKNKKLSLIPFFNISEIEFKENLARPKSLKGIENNNGWIKIESENYLPKEDGFYWVIDSDTCDVTDRYFELENHDYFKQFSSHYQKIIKPKKPLY